MNQAYLKEDLEIFRQKIVNQTNKLQSLLPKEYKTDLEILSIFFRGEITTGDGDFLLKFLEKANIPKGNGLVIINGPGGNTIEAIRIGIILREHFNKHLIISVPRIAGSAIVYITLFSDMVSLPHENAYLTTVNSTVVPKKDSAGHRLIPKKIIGGSDEKGYSVASCNAVSLELERFLKEEDVPEELLKKLTDIRGLLSKTLWAASKFTGLTKGNMVEKLFLEERTLQHEFLDHKELLKRGFPITKEKMNPNYYKTLKSLHDRMSSYMADRDIVYLITHDNQVACKFI